uniref:tyrosine-type recombinase/integrase n=1 Tax=Escherichia coli TaxID=562 RepID=UPI0021FAA91C|nr:tyrosine-type recombinase/integrase [Escherichia coli]CAH8250686.1 Tyrosine recombinase XerC [Escherichia coli]
MTDTRLLSPWVRRFLLEYLISDRNLSVNTQKSYRDMLRLLLPFASATGGKAIDKLLVEDLSESCVRNFMCTLGDKRQCGASTRNQRLAGIRSLARFIAMHAPEYTDWYGRLKSIPLRKSSTALISYLEKDEMDALLAAPDVETALGERDHAVLLFLYNTGARADEVAHVRIGDLNLNIAAEHNNSSVVIHGKGNRLRRCPLWPETARLLQILGRDRLPQETLFVNRQNRPLTRFGIRDLVVRNAAVAAVTVPSLSQKRVSPHTIRHTTATHLLRAGVDINTIRAWLGHVSLSTTLIYAEVDFQMKIRAITTCEPHQKNSSGSPGNNRKM